MICQHCGIEAPTRYVSFHQNIGMLVMRQSRSISGYLCKSCIHEHFWKFSGITLAIGWLGTVSFIITPFLLLNNLVRYVLCLGMSAVPPDAGYPELTEEAVSRLQPLTQEIFERLGEQQSLEEVARHYAAVADVTPGQVVLWIQAVSEAIRNQRE